MEDFTYKEYTEEENNIYNEAMKSIMDGLWNGMNFREACSSVCPDNQALKGYIEDDALKIMIAEMHFIKGLSLQNVADTLQLSMDIINKAHAEMMEDVEITSTEIYRLKNPDRPIGNA